jgi:glycosyltransferase involved in cell wall biosynthesis
MMRLLHKERVAVLHINQRFWRPAEVLAALLMRIPVLVHFHVVNRQEGSFMGLCQGAVCVSRYVAEHSLPRQLQKAVVYNPVDIRRFDNGIDKREEWGLEEQHVVVSYLGQIREIKGVQDFIAMARQLPHANARFILAGECRDPKEFPGSYTIQNLQNMIAGDSRIRYVGYARDVENVYCSSDIIVIPSRWEEPLGLINLEAGACRKPVVATRVGGIPEVITDGENGFLVEAGNVEALADRVSRLIADPALRTRMGMAGRMKVQRDFTQRPVREFESLLLSYVRD